MKKGKSNGTEDKGKDQPIKGSFLDVMKASVKDANKKTLKKKS